MGDRSKEVGLLWLFTFWSVVFLQKADLGPGTSKKTVDGRT